MEHSSYLGSQAAKHFREIHFGGNWTCVNLRDTLAGLTWQQATKQVYACNTIATLTYHIHYFVVVALKVLQGEPLIGNDKHSFDHPPITSQDDWENFVERTYTDAEHFARLLETLPDSTFREDFDDPKYGSYFRNIHGIIEHAHYHLGQMVIIKKMVLLEELK